MIRKGPGNGIDDGGFGLDIGLGDQVDDTFLVDRSKFTEMCGRRLGPIIPL